MIKISKFNSCGVANFMSYNYYVILFFREIVLKLIWFTYSPVIYADWSKTSQSGALAPP